MEKNEKRENNFEESEREKCSDLSMKRETSCYDDSKLLRSTFAPSSVATPDLAQHTIPVSERDESPPSDHHSRQSSLISPQFSRTPVTPSGDDSSQSTTKFNLPEMSPLAIRAASLQQSTEHRDSSDPLSSYFGDEHRSSSIVGRTSAVGSSATIPSTAPVTTSAASESSSAVISGGINDDESSQWRRPRQLSERGLMKECSSAISDRHRLSSASSLPRVTSLASFASLGSFSSLTRLASLSDPMVLSRDDGVTIPPLRSESSSPIAGGSGALRRVFSGGMPELGSFPSVREDGLSVAVSQRDTDNPFDLLDDDTPTALAKLNTAGGVELTAFPIPESGLDSDYSHYSPSPSSGFGFTAAAAHSGELGATTMLPPMLLHDPSENIEQASMGVALADCSAVESSSIHKDPQSKTSDEGSNDGALEVRLDTFAPRISVDEMREALQTSYQLLCLAEQTRRRLMDGSGDGDDESDDSSADSEDGPSPSWASPLRGAAQLLTRSTSDSFLNFVSSMKKQAIDVVAAASTPLLKPGETLRSLSSTMSLMGMNRQISGVSMASSAGMTEESSEVLQCPIPSSPPVASALFSSTIGSSSSSIGGISTPDFLETAWIRAGVDTEALSFRPSAKSLSCADSAAGSSSSTSRESSRSARLSASLSVPLIQDDDSKDPHTSRQLAGSMKAGEEDDQLLLQQQQFLNDVSTAVHDLCEFSDEKSVELPTPVFGSQSQSADILRSEWKDTVTSLTETGSDDGDPPDTQVSRSYHRSHATPSLIRKRSPLNTTISSFSSTARVTTSMMPNVLSEDLCHLIWCFTVDSPLPFPAYWPRCILENPMSYSMFNSENHSRSLSRKNLDRISRSKLKRRMMEKSHHYSNPDSIFILGCDDLNLCFEYSLRTRTYRMLGNMPLGIVPHSHEVVDVTRPDHSEEEEKECSDQHSNGITSTESSSRSKSNRNNHSLIPSSFLVFGVPRSDRKFDQALEQYIRLFAMDHAMVLEKYVERLDQLVRRTGGTPALKDAVQRGRLLMKRSIQGSLDYYQRRNSSMSESKDDESDLDINDDKDDDDDDDSLCPKQFTVRDLHLMHQEFLETEILLGRLAKQSEQSGDPRLKEISQELIACLTDKESGISARNVVIEKLLRIMNRDRRCHHLYPRMDRASELRKRQRREQIEVMLRLCGVTALQKLGKQMMDSVLGCEDDEKIMTEDGLIKEAESSSSLSLTSKREKEKKSSEIKDDYDVLIDEESSDEERSKLLLRLFKWEERRRAALRVARSQIPLLANESVTNFMLLFNTTGSKTNGSLSGGVSTASSSASSMMDDEIKKDEEDERVSAVSVPTVTKNKRDPLDYTWDCQSIQTRVVKDALGVSRLGYGVKACRVDDFVHITGFYGHKVFCVSKRAFMDVERLLLQYTTGTPMFQSGGSRTNTASTLKPTTTMTSMGDLLCRQPSSVESRADDPFGLKRGITYHGLTFVQKYSYLLMFGGSDQSREEDHSIDTLYCLDHSAFEDWLDQVTDGFEFSCDQSSGSEDCSKSNNSDSDQDDDDDDLGGEEHDDDGGGGGDRASRMGGKPRSMGRMGTPSGRSLKYLREFPTWQEMPRKFRMPFELCTHCYCIIDGKHKTEDRGRYLVCFGGKTGLGSRTDKILVCDLWRLFDDWNLYLRLLKQRQLMSLDGPGTLTTPDISAWSIKTDSSWEPSLQYSTQRSVSGTASPLSLSGVVSSTLTLTQSAMAMVSPLTHLSRRFSDDPTPEEGNMADLSIPAVSSARDSLRQLSDGTDEKSERRPSVPVTPSPSVSSLLPGSFASSNAVSTAPFTKFYETSARASVTLSTQLSGISMETSTPDSRRSAVSTLLLDPMDGRLGSDEHLMDPTVASSSSLLSSSSLSTAAVRSSSSLLGSDVKELKLSAKDDGSHKEDPFELEDADLDSEEDEDDEDDSDLDTSDLDLDSSLMGSATGTLSGIPEPTEQIREQTTVVRTVRFADTVASSASVLSSSLSGVSPAPPTTASSMVESGRTAVIASVKSGTKKVVSSVKSVGSCGTDEDIEDPPHSRNNSKSVFGNDYWMVSRHTLPKHSNGHGVCYVPDTGEIHLFGGYNGEEDIDTHLVYHSSEFVNEIETYFDKRIEFEPSRIKV